MTASQLQPEGVSGIVDEQSDLAASVDATGRFRIYLGAAPGVGKTYAMLSEGIRRKRRGIAFLQ